MDSIAIRGYLCCDRSVALFVKVPDLLAKRMLQESLSESSRGSCCGDGDGQCRDIGKRKSDDEEVDEP
jgi:hypothetical protein